jgi:hypothetical protein
VTIVSGVARDAAVSGFPAAACVTRAGLRSRSAALAVSAARAADIATTMPTRCLISFVIFMAFSSIPSEELVLRLAAVAAGLMLAAYDDHPVSQ